MQSEEQTAAVRDFIIFLVIASILFILKYPVKMSDFEVYYLTGERFLTGENIYNIQDNLEFKYLPVTAMLFSIFSLIPLAAAKILWCGTVALLTFLILYKSIKLSNEHYSSRLFYFIFLLFVMYLGRELLLGQINVVMIWLALLSLEQLIKGKEAKSGILMGLSTWVKPYTIIFLPYFLINRNYKAFLYSLLFFMIGLKIPFFLVGMEGGIVLYKACFHLLNTTSNENYLNPDNVSVWAFYFKYFKELNISRILAVITISGLYATFLFFVIRKPVRTAENIASEGAALLAFIPLFSPQGWFYQFIMAAPCILLLITAFKQISLLLKIIVVAMLFTIPLSLYDVSGKIVSRWIGEHSVLTVSFSVLIFISYLWTKRETNPKAQPFR